MRTSCTSCARKHLAQAMVLSCEALKGYPVHAWFAMGHMAEAEDELLDGHLDMANEIRQHRLAYQAAVIDGHQYFVPFGQLIEELSVADAPTYVEVDVPPVVE